MNFKVDLSEMYFGNHTVYVVLQTWIYGLNCVFSITDVLLPVEKGKCISF